ncbi:MAG TPA: FAD-dependent oxidoreductase, partial [bacterium]|nr:FAD-dependent oxidoreductase [bacterium]
MDTFVVLGAGLAGLNAALHLSESTDKRVIVLEREPRVGGLAASLEWKGARLDLGPHRIFTEIPEIRQLINDLVGDELIQVKRSSHMYLNNRFLAYPPRIGQMALALGPSKMIRWGLSYLAGQIPQIRRTPTDETYETFLCRQFGSALYQDFFLPFARKVWGTSPSKLSSDIVKTRVASKSLLHALLGKTDKKGRPSTLREFPYPKLGIGRIAERLKERLEARGVRIILESEPTLIKMSSKGEVLLAFQDRRSDQMVTAELKGVVSTIPLVELIEILRAPGWET